MSNPQRTLKRQLRLSRLDGTLIEAELLLDRPTIRIAASDTEVIIQVPGAEADTWSIHTIDLHCAVALAMEVLADRAASGSITGQMNLLAGAVLILSRALQ